MIGGHMPELILVLVAALVVFGPKRLPEIGSSLGKGIRDFRKHVSDLDRPDVSPNPHPVTAPVAESPETPAHESG